MFLNFFRTPTFEGVFIQFALRPNISQVPGPALGPTTLQMIDNKDPFPSRETLSTPGMVRPWSLDLMITHKMQRMEADMDHDASGSLYSDRLLLAQEPFPPPHK